MDENKQVTERLEEEPRKKNKKAKELGVEIISEDEFLERYNINV